MRVGHLSRWYIRCHQAACSRLVGFPYDAVMRAALLERRCDGRPSLNACLRNEISALDVVWIRLLPLSHMASERYEATCFAVLVVKLVKLSVSTFEHYVLAVLDVKLSVMLGWLRSHRCRGSQLGLDSAFESHRFRAIRSAMFRSP